LNKLPSEFLIVYKNLKENDFNQDKYDSNMASINLIQAKKQHRLNEMSDVTQKYSRKMEELNNSPEAQKLKEYLDDKLEDDEKTSEPIGLLSFSAFKKKDKEESDGYIGRLTFKKMMKEE
jgi:hypothetical protein